jgi:hypothetical protein
LGTIAAIAGRLTRQFCGQLTWPAQKRLHPAVHGMGTLQNPEILYIAAHATEMSIFLGGRQPRSLPLRSDYRVLYVLDGVLDGVRLAMEHDKVRDLQARQSIYISIDFARSSRRD